MVSLSSSSLLFLVRLTFGGLSWLIVQIVYLMRHVLYRKVKSDLLNCNHPVSISKETDLSFGRGSFRIKSPAVRVTFGRSNVAHCSFRLLGLSLALIFAKVEGDSCPFDMYVPALKPCYETCQEYLSDPEYPMTSCFSKTKMPFKFINAEGQYFCSPKISEEMALSPTEKCIPLYECGEPNKVKTEQEKSLIDD